MDFRDPNGNEIAGWHIKTDPLLPFSLIAKLPSLPPSLPPAGAKRSFAYYKCSCNVGYGFVNLTSPEAAFRLYKAFHQQPWEVFNSRKICQVTYARLQVDTGLSRVRRCLLSTVTYRPFALVFEFSVKGIGGAQGALQEVQVRVRQRRVHARGLLSAP
ncbi:hypothetical protein B296_00055731 [Ensete ventricosum]|uniref:Mei2-like C-terminal RNA recognition motif domain-containing protein n=1 Tax=Ensete ventricosum TaxID=4639 RepID=A0A426X3G9_ENSVE|nr:hypothetical protein B296_00055731 [Ensete ventricosum]